MARGSLGDDSGLNTNPRRFESDYGFYSAPTAVVGPAATEIWTAATTPARTAGLNTTIYELHIENSTGAAVTVWLEVEGVAITPPYHVANNDTPVIDWPAGFAVGDQDIDLNASAAAVVGEIFGTEI